MVYFATLAEVQAAAAEAAPSDPALSHFSKESAAMSFNLEISLPPVAVQASVPLTAGVEAFGAGREQGRALGADSCFYFFGGLFFVQSFGVEKTRFSFRVVAEKKKAASAERVRSLFSLCFYLFPGEDRRFCSSLLGLCQGGNWRKNEKKQKEVEVEEKEKKR